MDVQGAPDGRLQRSAQEVQTGLERATQTHSVSLRVDGPPPAAAAAGTQFTGCTGTKVQILTQLLQLQQQRQRRSKWRR
jgi:hypothetical protein